MATMTRRELRRTAANRLSDWVPVEATADGDFTTLIDTTHLVRPPEGYAGMDLVLSGGAALNVGLTRYIVTSNSVARAIQWSDPLPAAITQGTMGDLFNDHRMGLTAHEWNQTINDALYEARGMGAYSRVTADLALSYSDVPYLLIPDEVEWAWAISYADEEAIVRYPTRSSRGALQGFAFETGSRLVRFYGDLPATLDGYTPVVHGFGPPQPMADDDDTTDLSAPWLIARVACLAAQHMIQKGRPSLAITAEGLRREAERHAGTLADYHFPPNTVRLVA